MTERATALLALVVGLGGCKPVGPDYSGAPKVEHSGRFFGGRGGDSPPALDKWWHRLGSRELDGLVDDALKGNRDLAIAGQRLREARAMRRATASALLPRAGANLSFTRIDAGGLFDDDLLRPIAGAGFFDDPLDYWGTGVDVGWEIDIFGGRRRELRGARAREQAEAEALGATRLAIVAEVAEAYFALAALREQRAVVGEQVALQQRQADDVRERLEAGASSRLDLDRSVARLEITRSALPGLEAGITGQLRRITLLVGAPPGALDDRDLGRARLPANLPMVMTGLPAELITRRPDLRRKERELAAATEEIGVAVASFYPKFSFGGGPAAAGESFGNLFNASSIYWQYGPRVEWTPFSAGANRAALERADARQRAALLDYEKAVHAAIAEVETQLAQLGAETRRLAIVQRARAAAASSARRVRENHEGGAVDLADVLIEEAQLREVEISEIRAKSQMLQVWIRLHKALGGGWK